MCLALLKPLLAPISRTQRNQQLSCVFQYVQVQIWAWDALWYLLIISMFKKKKKKKWASFLLKLVIYQTIDTFSFATVTENMLRFFSES